MVFVFDEGAFDFQGLYGFVAARERFCDGFDVDFFHDVCCAIDIEVKLKIDDVVML